MTRERALRSAALDMLRRLDEVDKKHAAYLDAEYPLES